MERARRHAAAAILGAGLLAAILPDADLLAAGGASSGGAGEKALRRGFVQEESVQLILLDVVVTDDEGRPVRGLTKKDFEVRLDWRRWPIYSVDELCRGAAAPGGEEGPGLLAEPGGGSAAGRTPAPPLPDQDRMRFVLYLDFSQLGLMARRRAIGAAIRWVDEVKEPSEEAMIEAYVSKQGLRTLARFTSDAAALRAALEAALDDRTLIDEFPALFGERVAECRSCFSNRSCPDCIACVCEPNALAEYQHGKHALEALRQFMAELGAEPGRKAVIFMHENTFLSPGKFFAVPRADFRIGFHRPLLEAVAAEATSSRAAVYAAYFGASPPGAEPVTQSIEAGYELASFSGGAHSRSSHVAFDLMRQAGREAGCAYRIAFKPRDGRSKGIHQAVVRAAGRRLAADYRVKLTSDEDRLMRRAQSALRDPAAETDLSVAVALVPIEAERRRWSASVRVTVEAGSLGLLPAGESREGHLDVGALLVNERTGKSWEMMAGSEIRTQKDAAGRGVLLYETRLERLAAGPYRLRAFAHDKALDLYGAAETSLVLPEAEGLVGPLAACPRRAVYAAELPLRGDDTRGRGLVEAREGMTPYAGGKLARGERLLLDSWICSKEDLAPGENLIRIVERRGEPLFRLPEGWTHAGGRCQRFTDLLDTIELSPGDYAYRLIWNPAGAKIPVSRTLEFSVGPGAPRFARDASSR